MSSNRIAAIALIAGTLAGYVTMFFHPTGADVIAAASGGASNSVAMAVHFLAWLGQGATLAGAVGITHRLWSQRELAVGSYVFFTLAAVAALVATAASGFVAPRVVAGIAAADTTAREAMMSHLRYTWYINQTFSMMCVLFTSVAILLWSIAMLRARTMGRGLGGYGVVLSVALVAAVVLRLLPLDVHGFGIVVLTQGVWMMWAAGRLWGGEADLQPGGGVDRGRPR